MSEEQTSADFWRQNRYYLDRMGLRDLTRAYFAYPDIIVYLFLATAAGGVAVFAAGSIWQIALPAVFAVVVYPLVWYALHRWLLHSRFLYRNKWTASLWARIDYAHHQDPHDLRVLFGALYTTLPTLVLVTMPAGWLLGGAAGVAAAFSAGVLTTMFYEFCHCIEHLRYAPTWQWLQRMKRLHLMHHFRNETVNFGITNFFWDRLFGTYCPAPEGLARSNTVFNLGYTDEQRQRYPWVAELARESGLIERTVDEQPDISNEAA